MSEGWGIMRQNNKINYDFLKNSMVLKTVSHAADKLGGKDLPGSLLVFSEYFHLSFDFDFKSIKNTRGYFKRIHFYLPSGERNFPVTDCQLHLEGLEPKVTKKILDKVYP